MVKNVAMSPYGRTMFFTEDSDMETLSSVKILLMFFLS